VRDWRVMVARLSARLTFARSRTRSTPLSPPRTPAKLLARLHTLEIILANKKSKSAVSLDGVSDPKLIRNLQTGLILLRAPCAD